MIAARRLRLRLLAKSTDQDVINYHQTSNRMNFSDAAISGLCTAIKWPRRHTWRQAEVSDRAVPVRVDVAKYRSFDLMVTPDAVGSRRTWTWASSRDYVGKSGRDRAYLRTKNRDSQSQDICSEETEKQLLRHKGWYCIINLQTDSQRPG